MQKEQKQRREKAECLLAMLVRQLTQEDASARRIE
jgi:hypothetical protein